MFKNGARARVEILSDTQGEQSCALLLHVVLKVYGPRCGSPTQDGLEQFCYRVIERGVYLNEASSPVYFASVRMCLFAFAGDGTGSGIDHVAIPTLQKEKSYERLAYGVATLASPTTSDAGSTGLGKGIIVLNVAAPLLAGDDGNVEATNALTAFTAAMAATTSAPSGMCAVCSADAARTGTSLAEEPAYGAVTAIRPAWSQEVSTATSASDLYGTLSATLVNTGGLGCKPELRLRSSQPFAPAFNVELKTAGDHRLYDAAGTYALLELHRNYFEVWCDDEAPIPTPSPSVIRNDARPALRPWRFFFRPPVGYSVCGSPPMAMMVRAEWAGRLFLTPCLQPFFIGSAQHRAVAEALPPPPEQKQAPSSPSTSSLAAVSGDCGDLFIDLSAVAERPVWDRKVASGERQPPAVWTSRLPLAVPGLARSGLLTTADASAAFFKVAYWNWSGAGHIKRMVRGYSIYAAAWMQEVGGEAAGGASSFSSRPVTMDPPPSSLLPATLLFGRAMLAVAMPFVVGARCATEVELMTSAGQCRLLWLMALAWLARHDLLHADVRPPNVLVVPSLSPTTVVGSSQ